ncbi:MAG: spermidine synthase [Halieaceae bacterium]|jgi:spermidine synthase
MLRNDLFLNMDKVEIVRNKQGYRELLINGELHMSDIPIELYQYEPYFENYRGDVLIMGMGMGVINDLTDYKKVTSMDIVELYPGVVDLNKSYPNTNVIIADGRSFVPTKLYDVIWIDIWNLLHKKNLPEMRQMKEKFEKYLKPGGWVDCWGRRELEIKYADYNI